MRVTCGTEEQTITFTPLLAPERVSAHTLGDKSIQVNWETSINGAQLHDGANEFMVSVGKPNGVFTTLATGVTGCSFVAEALPQEENWVFMVHAGFNGVYETSGSEAQLELPERAKHPQNDRKGKPHVSKMAAKEKKPTNKSRKLPSAPMTVEKQVDHLMEGNIVRLRNAFPGLEKSAIKKVAPNSYQIGSKKITLAIHNEKLMVRAGGGYQEWNKFIDSHYNYLRSFIVPDVPISGLINAGARNSIVSSAQLSSYSA